MSKKTLKIIQRLRNRKYLVLVGSFITLALKVVLDYDLPPGYNELANSALLLLAGLGVVVDGTTPGILDTVETE